MVDQERFAFDELAKGLAGGTVSRRKVLRLLGAAFVGTTLASVPGMAWAAKTPRPPKPDGRCSQNKPCPAGQGCCNRTCVDLQSDPNNCGSCGNSCPEGVPCTNGGCVVCGPNQVCCGVGFCREDEGPVPNACCDSPDGSCVAATCQCP